MGTDQPSGARGGRRGQGGRSGPGRGGRRLRWLLAAWTVLVAAGCNDSVTASAGVSQLAPIEPRTAWAGIYHDVEACTGVEGDFAQVEWFRAGFIGGGENEVAGGAWLVAEGRPHGIALLEDLLQFGPEDELRAVVRHEAIHEILQLSTHAGTVWCRCDDRPGLFAQCG